MSMTYARVCSLLQHKRRRPKDHSDVIGPVPQPLAQEAQRIESPLSHGELVRRALDEPIPAVRYR
jgi:hypothetical protein